jgi:hypothetical protein
MGRIVRDVLHEAEWIPRRDEHRHRVAARLGAYLDGRAAGAPDPVVDFLFSYYTLRPGQLMRWHPGFGIGLSGPSSEEYARLSGYHRDDGVVTVNAGLLAWRKDTIAFVARLLAATASRTAQLGCFGLHEWAMVYHADPDAVRHRAVVPLRLGTAGTDAVVESLPLRCTHFDAFRFFTDPARSRNHTQLSREAQPATEQPGCLHAAMDLYKWGIKLLPLIDSDTVLEAFEVAYSARELDMRASPYDLRALGYEPVRIETPSGRAEYVREQTAIAHRAAEVRERLLARCRALLGAADQ